MKTTITSMAIALLFAVTANADVIHMNDYETTGAADGTGFMITSSNMGFTGGGGDLIGFDNNGGAGITGDALGLSSANANSGSFHYAVDTGATAAAGNGWGGSWTGINSTDSVTSGGFGVEADVITAGVGSYINYTEGAVFTVSAMVATDALDPLIGTGTVAPRLEFLDAAGVELFRNQSAQVDATSIGTGAYTLLTHSYTLTAADEGTIFSVGAVLGTDGNGHDAGNDGLVYYDDFVFEVSGANVVTLAVPEPATTSLLLAGLIGFCGVRRRKN